MLMVGISMAEKCWTPSLRLHAGGGKCERFQRLSSWNAFSVMALIVSQLHSYSTQQ